MDNKRQGRNVFVSTFRVPDEYERARMEAERRATLAQMLEAQAYQPLDVRQPAPIAPSQGLAKVLKSYLGAYEKRKAREAEEKAKGEELETASEIQGRLMGLDEIFSRDSEGKLQSIYATPEEQQAQIEADIARQRASGQLEEMTPTAQYIRDPEEALRLADTPAGQAALKNRPVMAAKLAELLKTPEKPAVKTMEIGGQLVNVTDGVATPVTTAAGTPFTAPATPTELSRLIAERDSLEPNDPRKATYDARIARETAPPAPGAVVNLDTKGSQLGQELYLRKIDSLEGPARNAGRILGQVNAMDEATKRGTFTGSMAPTAIGAAQFLSSFGLQVKPEILANSRAFEAASSRLVLDFMAANGGARGFTEKETAILQDAFPKIVDSPEARQQIAELLRDKALQDVEDYNFALEQFKTTFPSVVTPYQPIDNEELRYQRWKRSQGGVQ
jgi:hypothetical protein